MNRLIFLILQASFILNLLLSSFIYSQENQKNKRSQTFWQWNLSSGSYPVHYIEKGAGPCHILLLHGFAAHSFTWNFIIEDLVQAGYHVWCLDLIGFGYSAKPKKLSYDLSLFTNQIEAFMRAKEISQACVVGNSMGGGLALSLAMAFPHRVKSLVLIDALAFPLKLPFYFAITKRLGKCAKPFIGKTMVKKILHQIVYDPKKISEEQIRAYTFPFHTKGGKEAFIQTLQNFNNQELEAFALRFKELKMPTLIIWGEKDKWIPLTHFKRLSQALPNAKTRIIANCGHIPQEECPLEVSQAIVQFLMHNKQEKELVH